MLQSVHLIHFLLMISSSRVEADSFFLGEHGGNAEGELSITKSHFACDHNPGCMAVKYDRETKQSQLIQGNGGKSIMADKNEIVWKKGENKMDANFSQYGSFPTAEEQNG